jgi:hypothetical protein
MTTSAKYEFEAIAYNTMGWNGILTTNVEKTEDYLHTRLLVTLGENVDQYDAVYIASDGLAYKAKGDQIHQPAIGLVIEEGLITEENIRVQRIGPIINSAWSWAPGKAVYLSSAVLGGLSQDVVTPRRQFMGIPISGTALILFGLIDREALATDGNILRPSPAGRRGRLYPAQYISE